jgi:AcrR family transcriptional regulator
LATAVQQLVPDKREAILDAALQLFVERGFYGTAVPEVAKRARVAAGTIYNYFPSKEALVNALFRKWKEALARRVYTAFPMTAPPREQFDVMWREMAAFALAHPDALKFLELHHHRPYLDAESAALQHQLKQFAKGVCKAGQDAGVFKPMDPALLIELLFGAFLGMMRAQWDGGVDLDERAVEEARVACWALVARPT